MITYKRASDPISFLLTIFRQKGSVFGKSFLVALPCAVLTLGLKLLAEYDLLPFSDPKSILMDNAVWSGFSFLVGFLIVFRTSQAYSRFWDGCTATHLMRAEWFDACSAVVAFCKASQASDDATLSFMHTVVSLFSMIHALALAELEDSNSDELEAIQAFGYDLVDVNCLDHKSMQTIKDSDSKVELVYQWIQQLLVENLNTGILCIPPPILSRVFQELANGMVQFHQAIKISTIPFPFPYAQTCDCLLLMHWLVTPFVISQWVTRYEWALIFSFIQAFIVWSLRFIATEIENPFGLDENDIDARAMQLELNRNLILLIERSTQRTPPLPQGRRHLQRTSSFQEAWNNLEVQGLVSDAPVRRSGRRFDRNSSTISNIDAVARSGRKKGVSSSRLGTPGIGYSETLNTFHEARSSGSATSASITGESSQRKGAPVSPTASWEFFGSVNEDETLPPSDGILREEKPRQEVASGGPAHDADLAGLRQADATSPAEVETFWRPRTSASALEAGSSAWAGRRAHVGHTASEAGGALADGPASSRCGAAGGATTPRLPALHPPLPLYPEALQLASTSAPLGQWPCCGVSKRAAGRGDVCERRGPGPACAMTV